MMEYEDIFGYCQAYDNSFPIDVNLSIDNSHISKLIENVLTSFPISQNAKSKTHDQVVEYLFMLIANFAKAYSQGECVAIPRSSCFFNAETAFSNRKLSKGTFVAVLEFLKQNGFIAEHRGYYDQESQLGRISRYWANRSLYDNFATVKTSDFYTVRDIPSVILHDQTKKEVEFSQNKISQFFSEKIFIVNSFYKYNVFQYIDKESIKYNNPYNIYTNNNKISNIETYSILGRNTEPSKELLYPRVSAVFSRKDFNCGGRLYSIAKRGIGFQSLSQEQRKTITINDEPTIELDFCGLHISMLYAIMGIQIQKDPYSGLAKELRPLYKTLLLRLLNAASIGGTVKSMIDTVRKLKNKPFLSLKDFKFLSCVEQQAPAWLVLIAELMEQHKPVRRFFGSDCGVYLQRLDGEMMLNIITKLTSDGIPSLPIHDSVIVPISAQGKAIEVMKEVYRRYMGFDCEVKAG